MRLNDSQRQIIKSAVARVVGAESRVWLFGSRTDDTQRGGDIDLLVETAQVIPDRVGVLCKLEGTLVMGLGDRKFDIVHQGCAYRRCANIRGSPRERNPAVSPAYLAEYGNAALIALDLAEREAAHLRYTRDSLYQQPIDLAWVEALAQREDLSEKIDAFVGRFGRLQDHIGEKLLPVFARLVGGQPKSLLDVMAFAERMGWVENAEDFIGARKLRNLLVHEYMTAPSLFFEALMAARAATESLFKVIASVKREAITRGIELSK